MLLASLFAVFGVASYGARLYSRHALFECYTNWFFKTNTKNEALL